MSTFDPPQSDTKTVRPSAETTVVYGSAGRLTFFTSLRAWRSMALNAWPNTWIA